jgi:hypothetical protein
MQQPSTWVAALIGDMVGSRQAPHRLDLQRRVGAVLEEVGRVVGGNPSFTIGDEFQGRFPTLADAVEASLQLHLRTLGLIRLRIGIGWGELLGEDPEQTPFAQDGPCWWRARDAIEAVDRSTRGRAPGLRTAARTETGLDPLLNGYLLLRDTTLGEFDDVDARIAIGLIDGLNQAELAGEIGLNKSSVSRRASAHGILALVEARSIGVPPLPRVS